MGIVDHKKVAQASEAIHSLREELKPLLEDTPDLAARADNVLLRLAQGLEHATMATSNPASTGLRTRPELKTFMGKPVPQQPGDMRQALEEAEPTKTELDAAREAVDKAYLAFPELSAKDIREFYEDGVIRGVAKRAGMEITSTSPKHLTNEYIESIKTAMTKKAAADAKVNEVEKQSAKIIEAEKKPA